METRANYVAVGAFVLVLLAGAAGVLLWLVGNQFSTVVAYYEISFTGSVSGLDKDSQVRYNGVPIGKVTEIDIDQVNPNHIRVVVALDPVVIIRSDVVAELKTPLVSGGSTIEITGGTNNAPPLPHREEPPYPLIKSESSGLQSLFDKAPDVLQHVGTLADRVMAILDENRGTIKETLDNIRKVTDVLAKRSEDIDKILAEGSASMTELHQTLKDADETVRQATLDLKHVDSTLGRADTVVGHSDTLLGHADSFIQENRPGVRDFTQRGLGQLNALISDTRSLVDKLGRVIDELERDPSRFLFGDRNGGYKPK